MAEKDKPQTPPAPPQAPEAPKAEQTTIPTPDPAQTALNDADRAELEQYRAEKKAREDQVKAEAAAEAERLAKKSPLDADPRSPEYQALSREDQIRGHYLHARGTIQDYARIWRLTVEEVLTILGQDEMNQVEQAGDLIGLDELGPNGGQIKTSGDPARPTYSTN